MPKRAMDVMQAEVNRVLQLGDSSVVPITWQVPRKVIYLYLICTHLVTLQFTLVLRVIHKLCPYFQGREGSKIYENIGVNGRKGLKHF